jgi:glycerol-3-phosphate O-acyltransferase
MNEAGKADTLRERIREMDRGHVEGVLDEIPPWVFRKLVPILSSRVRIDDRAVERIRDTAAAGPVVYAMKFRSVYDLHFLRLRFAELGLPVPSFVFGMSTLATGSLKKACGVWKTKLSGFVHERKWPPDGDENVVRDILEQGGAGALFLVDEKTSRRRYVHPNTDPLRMLHDLQGRVAGCISIVPLFILYDRRLRRSIRPFWETFLGDPDRPGPIARIVSALRKWTVPELLVGEPIHMLGELEEFESDRSWEEAPLEVREKLIHSINDRIRVARGPEKLSGTEIKERVLRDSRVQRAVQEAASSENITTEKARSQAESYVDEIAADQRYGVIHFLYYALRWIFSRLFDGVDYKPSEFNALKECGAKGTLIFVPSHKSHFDYLLVGWITFVNQMALPLIAAGTNLTFWPIGPLFRTGAAFFIRRSFKGLGLYARVFAAYLKVLTEDKVSIKFFIEGGRSRTGKLLPPKLGMLSFLVQTVEEGHIDDLYFVPVFTGYDQNPEEREFLRELEGHEKKKETFSGLLKARKILSGRFGRAYVRFHEPISLREFYRQWGDTEPGRLSARESRRLLVDFAYHIMYGIVESGIVNPIDLTASALLCRRNSLVSRDQLFEAVGYFSESLRREGIEFSESLNNTETAVLAAMHRFIARGLVTEEVGEGQPAAKEYAVVEQRRATLEFYKNGLVNYLWPASILSMILLARGSNNSELTDEMRCDFKELTELLSKELIVDPLVGVDSILNETWDFFREKEWGASADRMSEDAAAIRPLRCFRGILTHILEVYRLVLVTAAKLGDEGMSLREFTKKMEQTVREETGEEKGRIPTLGSATVGNALLRFRESGILYYRPSKKSVERVRNEAARLETLELLDRINGHRP